MAEARELNHSYVGTEHLLIGLLREEKALAAHILTANGVTLPAVRAETVRLLGDAAQPPEAGIRRAAVAGAAPHAQPITGAEYDAALATPRNVLAQFYAAFNTCDLAMMAANWSSGPDVVMDNPLGGITRGWEAIRAVYERIFDGPARVAVEFHDYTLHTTGDFFYAVGRERGVLERDGKELALAIRTTRVFRREGLEWRQVHHHGSMDDPAMLEAYQKLVRA